MVVDRAERRLGHPVPEVDRPSPQVAQLVSVGRFEPTATTSTAGCSGDTAAPAHPEWAAAALISPHLAPEPLPGLWVVSHLAFGVAMAVIAVAAVAACILIAYPTPTGGLDIPLPSAPTRTAPPEKTAGAVPSGTVRHANPTARAPRVPGPHAPATASAPAGGRAPATPMQKQPVRATSLANPDPSPKPGPSLSPSKNPSSESEYPKILSTTEPTFAPTTEPVPDPTLPIVDPLLHPRSREAAGQLLRPRVRRHA